MANRAAKNRLRHGYKTVLIEKKKHGTDIYRSERPAYVSRKATKNRSKGYDGIFSRSKRQLARAA